jgi:hypothetical protein
VAELSPEEKEAGRKFRERAVQLMELSFAEIGDAHVYPLYLNFVRHVCPKKKGRTWAVHLREYIVFSPEMAVRGTVVEEATFGYVWRAGSCSCGFTARSDIGRVILAANRTPLRGAVEVELDPLG